MKVDSSLAQGCLAVVTGGNRGIGLAIIRLLCEELGDKSRVIMCARNKEQAEAALKTLHEAGHRQVEIYHPLEVTSNEQVKALAAFVKQQGGCDILINNAGMGTNVGAPVVLCVLLCCNLWIFIRERIEKNALARSSFYCIPETTRRSASFLVLVLYVRLCEASTQKGQTLMICACITAFRMTAKEPFSEQVKPYAYREAHTSHFISLCARNLFCMHAHLIAFLWALKHILLFMKWYTVTQSAHALLFSFSSINSSSDQPIVHYTIHGIMHKK